MLCDGVQHLAGGIARREALRIGSKAWQIGVPSAGKLALLQSLDFVAEVWVFGFVRLHKLRPALLKLPPTLADAGAEVFTHALGDEKLGVLRPAIAALRQTDFFDPERFAMRGAGIVLMGRAVADMAVDDNQGRYVVGMPEGLDRLCEPLAVIGVADALHVPAIGKEARGHVVAEGEIRVTFDRDAVAVVNPAEVSEHQVTRERGGFARDAFHHVAVTAEQYKCRS